ncbi:hypothetical protein JTB14_017393 [Gonioctena quinquepunctata]|nr:hypothetical protein JTB14_017393 [Gonioctena quinquepunctata]
MYELRYQLMKKNVLSENDVLEPTVLRNGFNESARHSTGVAQATDAGSQSCTHGDGADARHAHLSCMRRYPAKPAPSFTHRSHSVAAPQTEFLNCDLRFCYYDLKRQRIPRDLSSSL